MTIDYKHPLVVTIVGVIATAALGVFIWAKDFLIQRLYTTELNASIQNINQFVELNSPQPKIGKDNVYCDTIKFDLYMSHNQTGSASILIDKIAFRATQIQLFEIPQDVKCHINALSSRPYGIAQRDTYLFSIKQGNTTAKFIESEKYHKGYDIDTNNILDKPGNKISINLSPVDSQYVFNAYVSLHSNGYYKAYFDIYYHISGLNERRHLSTNSFFISK